MNSEPSSGLLVLVCAATGGEVGTGVKYTQLELAETNRVTLHELCPFCGETHLFKFAEARVITAPFPEPAAGNKEGLDHEC